MTNEQAVEVIKANGYKYYGWDSLRNGHLYQKKLSSGLHVDILHHNGRDLTEIDGQPHADTYTFATQFDPAILKSVHGTMNMTLFNFSAEQIPYVILLCETTIEHARASLAAEIK